MAARLRVIVIALAALAGAWTNWASVPAAALESAPAPTIPRSPATVAIGRLGLPYAPGADGPRRFDSAGLARYVFARFGIRLPSDVHDQEKRGVRVNPGNPGRWRPGDLVFFGRRTGTWQVGILLTDRMATVTPSLGRVRLKRIAADDLRCVRRILQPTADVETEAGRMAVAFARLAIGAPWLVGGATPSGFDDPGLARYVYRRLGCILPRSANAQYACGPRIDRTALCAGDLVFFGTDATHVRQVGVYVADGQMIDTAAGETVGYDAIDAADYLGATRPVNSTLPRNTPVVGVACAMLGTPYVAGGASPIGFDDSGLTSYCFAAVGVSLPHDVQAQFVLGPQVPADDILLGDLVFFGPSADAPTAVGIYVGGGTMITVRPGGWVMYDGLQDDLVGVTRP
jgi:cell wall-associated NlpC family hydrolase